MEYEDSPPQLVVIRTVSSTSQTVKEALIKGGIAAACAVFSSVTSFLAIRKIKEMDKAKEDLEQIKMALAASEIINPPES